MHFDRRALLPLSALAMSLTAGAAAADGWIVTIGARGAVYPPYEGAGHEVVTPSPGIQIRRADSLYRFTPPDDGSSLALISNRYISFGPAVRFRLPRGNTGPLTGLDTVALAIEPGAFVSLWPTNWLRARVEGRRGVLGYQGWTGDAGLDLIHTGRKWSASIGPRVGFGDVHYFDTYFGVTPAEAARSPFIHTPYDPTGGRRYTGLEGALSHHLNSRWVVTADFGYHRLAKEAANSPIIEATGSPNDYSGGLSLSYSFKVGR